MTLGWQRFSVAQPDVGLPRILDPLRSRFILNHVNPSWPEYVAGAIALLVAIQVAIVLAYKRWLQISVRLHFGEDLESRQRDREAATRTRAFEGWLVRAWACLWFSVPFGVLHGMDEVLWPGFIRSAGWIQLGCFGLAILFCWAAFSKWQKPIES